MNQKQYKIGETVLQLEMPFSFSDKAPYSAFLTAGQVPDYRVQFSFADSIAEPSAEKIFDTREFFITNEKERRFYYRDYDFGGYYAVRCRAEHEKCFSVQIHENYKDKLFERILFSCIGFEELTTEQGGLLFHASIVDLGGKALLFTGPCGIGKSTQADLWAKHRQKEIINGDKALLFLKNGKPFVSGLPYSGSSKFCKNAILPVAAIVVLSQAAENSIQKQSGAAAFLDIYKSCYPIAYAEDLLQKQVDLAQQYSENVSVLRFACRKDESAVIDLERILYGK